MARFVRPQWKRRAREHEGDFAAPRQWIYRNLTPWRIHACFMANGELLPRPPSTGQGDGDDAVVKVLSIPALGEVTIPGEDAKALNTLKMRRLGQIEVRPAPSEIEANLPQVVMMFGWLAVALFFGAWALFGGGASALPWTWVAASVVAVPVAGLAVATVRELTLYRGFRAYCKSKEADNQSLEGVDRSGSIRSFVDGMPRQVAEVSVLIGAVAVSVIGLGVAIHLTTQLKELLPIEYRQLVRLRNPFGAVTSGAVHSLAFWQLLVGHIAQWVLVSVAALAPAAMYFQFDRQRLAAVQRRWVQEVFRLDPTVRTVRDIEAKYASQIESSFGQLGPDSGLRLGSGRRSPVIVATILLVVGWFLVISATHVPRLVTNASGTLVWPVAGGGAGPSGEGGPFPVAAFVRPELSLIGYAFLGAYVFTLFHVLRGYQRRDLHPKSYNTVVVRILAAYTLGLVVGVVYKGPVAEVLLFFVGFTPQSALVWLREKLSDDKGPFAKVPLREPAPLTHLEGIDLYDRTRLAEEGINNVQALAHADIVDLMSGTRICAAQLVDWTDQAILYLRLGGDTALEEGRPAGEPARALEAAGAPGAGPAAAPGGPDVLANLAHLRIYGVRTATDLVQLYREALRRGAATGNEAGEIEALRIALDVRRPGTASDGDVQPLQTIIDTLPSEEWFARLWNWRHPEFDGVDAWYWYLDGHDWTRARAEPLPDRVEAARQPLPPIAMARATARALTASPPADEADLTRAEPTPARYSGGLLVSVAAGDAGTATVGRLVCQFDTVGYDPDNLPSPWTAYGPVVLPSGAEPARLDFTVTVFSVDGRRISASPRRMTVPVPASGPSDELRFDLSLDRGEAAPVDGTGRLVLDISHAGRSLHQLEVEVPALLDRDVPFLELAGSATMNPGAPAPATPPPADPPPSTSPT